MRELSPKELKRDFSEFVDFETTAEIQPFYDIIGQKRAQEAVSLAFKIKNNGYNLYMEGDAGLGKASYAVKYAAAAAGKAPVPPDLCYVYNFQEPKQPSLLRLSPGSGAVLREEMKELVERLRYELLKTFADRELDELRAGILKRYSARKDGIIKNITEEARQQDFGIKTTNTGIYFMPIVDGEIISEEQFDDLSCEQKERISKNSEAISLSAATTMRTLKEWEKSAKKEISDAEFQTALFVVGKLMEPLCAKYADCAQILNYLKAVKEDILDNIDVFLEEEGEEEDIQSIMPWYQKRGEEELFAKYGVNLVVDNSRLSGAPVIVEHNPTYGNLVGEVEYDNEYGNFSTDFMKIKAGTFHKANGGFLIISAHDLLASVSAWEALKRMLKTGHAAIEPIREYTTGIALSGIKPEKAPISVKVILFGSYIYYDILAEYDSDFKKLFKMSAMFDDDMKADKENVSRVLGFVKRFLEREGLKDLDRAACVKILEYAARVAEHQNKLTARLGKLADIIMEASVEASGGVITGADISASLAASDARRDMYEEKFAELTDEGQIMIDAAGAKVGALNGLTVIDFGDYEFGRPAKITATTYVGKAGIVNIEKEADMSGSIHDKGLQVLIGFLGATYARDFPLSLSCRVCFEQNYSEIDGDSASSTELYAILSSLSGLPLSQEIAVTGSINQYGDIQPIGGVTTKIEGFFDLCASRGLTGGQGVIIPEANTRNLMLKSEVIEAVAAGKFHIYAISHVNEGIEILTGVKAGELSDKGKFPSDAAHGMVYRKLREYYKKSISE
ncbi:MAG: AAA family ATPase [Clostridiales bacterium]|jgi:predicted ATP-dependent protease|nr:AAA family ATPase [Clostridiales bacterium]